MRIIAVGDIMPGGVLSITNNVFATKDIIDFLAQGDLRVGNFECAVEVANPSSKKVSGRGNTIFIREKDVLRIKQLNIDIVSIANNHLFDLGPEGAFNAIDALDRLGIKHCGAGRNLEEAKKPVVVEKDGQTFAFLAFSDTRLDYMYEATNKEPGVNPLREQYVVDEIKKARLKYDHVIVIPHWGRENTYFPTLEVESLAKKMINAGACLVLGGHSHRIQPVVKKYHGIIVFSMGNFLFSNRIINQPRFTWYPKEPIDINALPQTIGCPLVDTPTIKLWRPLAYIGMMVDSNIGRRKMQIRYKLTYTDMNNCVDIMKEGNLHQRFILFLLGTSVKLGIYKYVHYICNYYKRRKRQKNIRRGIK
jgi:poly-gamma-glutamate synthesis protein (capsule biosynthesis protein)